MDSNRSSKKFSPEVRERAVRMAHRYQRQHPFLHQLLLQRVYFLFLADQQLGLLRPPVGIEIIPGPTPLVA